MGHPQRVRRECLSLKWLEGYEKRFWLVALCVCQIAFAYDITDFTRDAKAHHERI
jgi:hypothetical protein